MARRVQPAGQAAGIVLEKVERAFVRLGLSRARLLFAVSGGADSMALLEAASVLQETLGFKGEVATIDHGLRPESAREVALVEEAASARGFACHVERLGMAGGAGLEARARSERYRALERIREARGLEWIVTAHSETDQAETLLMRLSRGASLAGARGVLEKRGRVVRPLLGCSREELRAFVAERGVPFIEDPMNVDPSFLRVRIRREVLPALERAAGPGAAARLASFARWAQEDSALLEAWAAAARARLEVSPRGSLDAVGLAELEAPLRRRVLAALAQEAGASVDGTLLERMEQVLSRGGEVPLGRAARFIVSSGQGRVASSTAAGGVPEGEWTLERDGEPLVLSGGWELQWRSTPPAELIAGQATVQRLRVDGAAARLAVRYSRPGDRARGPGGRGRKLQDVLVDARVPKEERRTTPVVVGPTGEVVCVVGAWPKPGVRDAGPGAWLIARRR